MAKIESKEFDVSIQKLVNEISELEASQLELQTRKEKLVAELKKIEEEEKSLNSMVNQKRQQLKVKFRQGRNFRDDKDKVELPKLTSPPSPPPQIRQPSIDNFYPNNINSSSSNESKSRSNSESFSTLPFQYQKNLDGTPKLGYIYRSPKLNRFFGEPDRDFTLLSNYSTSKKPENILHDIDILPEGTVFHAVGESTVIKDPLLKEKEPKELGIKKKKIKKSIVGTYAFNISFEIIPDGIVQKLLDSVPKRKIVSLSNPQCINSFEGPEPPLNESFYDRFVAAKSISTYPHVPGKPKRDGEPICDRFLFQLYQNRAFAALADGCNWGEQPFEAAVRATKAFSQTMLEYHQNFRYLPTAAEFMVKSFEIAHQNIIEDKSDIWEAGTTTLAVVMAVELEVEHPDQEKWAIICCSVGDCKVYHWSHSTSEVTDVTRANRQNLLDVRDPGGRLGPYTQTGGPDFRNLALFYQAVSEGDFIILCSDGVHDNLDPQMLGKLPKDIGIQVSSWTDAEKYFPTKTEEAKTNFRSTYLKEKIIEPLSPETHIISPKDVSSSLIQHCYNITQKSREYMELKPTEKLPYDLVKYPGKLDHTTCLVFRVGRV